MTTTKEQFSEHFFGIAKYYLDKFDNDIMMTYIKLFGLKYNCEKFIRGEVDRLEYVNAKTQIPEMRFQLTNLPEEPNFITSEDIDNFEIEIRKIENETRN